MAILKYAYAVNFNVVCILIAIIDSDLSFLCFLPNSSPLLAISIFCS